MDLADIGELDEVLRYAKAHPFKVQLDFNRRFRVWQDTIHRNRRLHLASAPTREEFTPLRGRYITLDIRDAERLTRRAEREFGFVLEATLDDALVIKHYQVLLYRKRSIWSELVYQLSRYEWIGEKWDVSPATVTERLNKQLKGGW